MQKRKSFKYISAMAGLFAVSFTVLAQSQSVDPNFNPNKLIDDKVFADTQTFGGPAGVQKFLAGKNSVLADTDPSFLVNLKEPGIAMLKTALEDPESGLPRLRTAAELIWDASKQSGLNPQVILATLNKESGLITGFSDPNDPSLQTALDHAMGLNCGDNVGCWNLFPGFYYQLFGNLDSSGNRYLGAAKLLMKSFNTAGGRGPGSSKTGDSIVLDNTLGGYQGIMPQESVILANNATAALYRYTPHVFNGNYNFWKYFIAWFKYPNGTLLKVAGNPNTYIIQNGATQVVPPFVALARYIDLNSALTVSQTEFDSYATSTPYGPTDNTIVQVPGDPNKYVFIDSQAHLASDLVIKQRGLDPDLHLNLTAAELVLYQQGPILPPKDGTVIRGTANQAVYLVQNGKIALFSGYTFAQHKITAKQIYTVPDSEIATYTQSGFVAPLDGSLVKSPASGTVYLVQSGLKKPVLADVFKNQGYSIKNIATISNDEVNALSTDGFATPKDFTFFAVGSKTGAVYEFKEGTKHIISDFVAKQRGITADYVFSTEVATSWDDGIPVPPRDNTIVKSDSDATIYIVSGGQLRPLTYQAYLNRKITPKRINVLPQAEVDAYAKGDVVAK